MGWRPDPSTPLLNRIMFLFVDIRCSINHVREQCLNLGYSSKEIEKAITEALENLSFKPPEDYREQS
ncbi:RuvA C-terminal domain-containing protein [Paenibacillus sp. TAF58]